MAHVDASSVSLSFGKHRGVSLADVPRSYLEWTLAQGVLRSEALRPAVQAELVRQGSSSETTPAAPVPPRPLKAGPPGHCLHRPFPSVARPVGVAGGRARGGAEDCSHGAGVLSGRNEMSPTLRRAHSLLIAWLGTPADRTGGASDVAY
jgi:hypothetical protein